MPPDLNSDLKVHIELTFGVFMKKVNVWTGVATVESYGGIRRDLSWVNPQSESLQLLDYLQLKYEIAHYFAKKSEKEINSKKINAGNTGRINGIIETHINERDKALNEFDIESDFGSRGEIIDKWKLKLNNEEIWKCTDSQLAVWRNGGTNPAEKAVRNWTFVARINGSVSRRCAKPLGR